MTAAAHDLTPCPVLVMGLGSSAFGRERRVVRMVTHMPAVSGRFLVSKWEDGSVSRLLAAHGLPFDHASFGYLGLAKPRWTIVNIAQWPLLYRAVVRAYVRQRARAVYIVSLSAFLNAWPAVLMLRVLFGARVVFHLGDMPAADTVHRAIARLVERIADGIVVNSRAVGRSVERLGVDPRRIRVVHNGIDLDAFAGAAPLDLRARFGWDRGAVLVGFVGQLRPNKGAGDLVAAAEIAVAREPRCRFVLVGEASGGYDYGRRLEQEIATRGLGSRVALAGRIDEVERVYAALDVVALPSRYEDPAPNVAIEAMAAGRPVVGTRIGGTPELIQDGRTGFLVTHAQPLELAERIVQLARDPQLRETMGFAAQSYARARFDIRRNALALQALLVGPTVSVAEESVVSA